MAGWAKQLQSPLSNGLPGQGPWDGGALTRYPAIIPSLYSSNYFHTMLGSQFAASPDGRYVAFQTDQVLEENIGMIENAR